ncbi:KAT8 regulatory NSL complex subunit 3 [Tanacetum coccineum]
MNKDVNVLRQSPLFNDLKAGKALDVPFVANNVTYKRGYYPSDKIYPQCFDSSRSQLSCVRIQSPTPGLALELMISIRKGSLFAYLILGKPISSIFLANVVLVKRTDISERKPPPKAEKLVEFHSGIVKEIANKYLQPPLILVGKSMGSSCMVAVEDGAKASAVVCLGYPLKGTKGTIRDTPLLQLEVPTMFVQRRSKSFKRDFISHGC